MVRSVIRRRLLATAASAGSAAALGGAGTGLLSGAASARTPPSPEQDERVLTFLPHLQPIEHAVYDQGAATPTHRPDLVPGRVSHGCIRMRNADILKLAQLMPVGTPLTIT